MLLKIGGTSLAGDVAADLPVLHEASADGAIAGRNAAAFPAAIPVARHPFFSICKPLFQSLNLTM